MLLETSMAMPTYYMCFYSKFLSREYGLAIIVQKNLCEVILKFKPVSDWIRIIDLKRTILLSVLAVYAFKNEYIGQLK